MFNIYSRIYCPFFPLSGYIPCPGPFLQFGHLRSTASQSPVFSRIQDVFITLHINNIRDFYDEIKQNVNLFKRLIFSLCVPKKIAKNLLIVYFGYCASIISMISSQWKI